MQLALKVARQNSGLIADNIRSQLSEGKAGDNRDVGRYTSTPYAIRKSSISSAPFGVVDLKLSGKLHRDIFVKMDFTKVTVDSKVSYSKYQIARYGDRIYDSNPENSDKVKDKNSIQIVREYSRLLGL